MQQTMILLDQTYLMNWLKLILLILINKILKKRIKDVDKKIPDTSNFVVNQEFNRSTKLDFNARMALATKRQL